jgi:hypothetical protein
MIYDDDVLECVGEGERSEGERVEESGSCQTFTFYVIIQMDVSHENCLLESQKVD